MSGHNTDMVIVAIIHDNANRVLIARRADSKQFQPGMFECIGGHLEPGESIEDGLRREVFEEIGAKVKVGQIFDAFTYSDEEGYKIEVSYLCTLEPGETPTLNPEDHSEFLWISADEIDKFEKEDEETEALRKAFKILKKEEK